MANFHGRMKRISVAAGVLLMVIAAYLWASPYITIGSISNAILDRDPEP